MTAYPQQNPYPGLNQVADSKPQPMPVIESAFSTLEGNQEQLMKAVQSLLLRIQPVSRQEPEENAKVEPDGPVPAVPIAERIFAIARNLDSIRHRVQRAEQRIEL